LIPSVGLLIAPKGIEIRKNFVAKMDILLLIAPKGIEIKL